MNIEGDDPWRRPHVSQAAENVWSGENKGSISDTVIDNSPSLLSHDPFGPTTLNEPSLSAEVKETIRVNYNERNINNTDSSTMEQSVWGQATTSFNNINSSALDKLNSAGNDAASENGSKSELLDSWIESVRKTFVPLSSNIVVVEKIPEREGILFKHTNYLVKHLISLPNTTPSPDRTVIRRYSDFSWLQEVLLQRYPFRMIPELPPKKIGTQNSDPVFLARRRKGLTRFINLVMKHPVLRIDDLVLTFLTVPTDLSSWRKQANYDTSEEFTDQKIDKAFLGMWHKDLSVQWNKADENIDGLLESWIKISVLVERYEKRMKHVSEERRILGTIMEEFSANSNALYPLDLNSINDINNHINIVSKHLHKLADISENEQEEVEEELSVKFKTFIDFILALKGVFERYKMMAGNNIPQLQRRVEINLDKLRAIEGKADTKGAEYERIKGVIQRDKRTITDQLNRSWLIRKCILEEFVIFQETQFVITSIFQEWAKMHTKYVNEHTECWERLYSNMEDMPFARNI
ncbi:HCL013Cp [Eremothecium sinecaudum]|uniref:Sorting nexin MVP1 n=1 Tax=Eremothecium sinecaudum TaxID=45286 RepID=A0A0X8HRL2_9SACH|nr:HCL013Cp [Eremothecium sinecaudum]AMD20138.1 HCL013Cp [Eremothecium sinecaudum]